MKRVLAWALAVVTAAIGGTAVQVHLNASAIAALGVSVPVGERGSMLGHDLLHFAPTYSALVAAAFLVAWPVTGALARWRPRWRRLLFPVAGFAALATMLWMMELALPVTAIAAARTMPGALALCLAGALGGLVYVGWTSAQKSSSA
ncbi:hypothetical protein [Halomonas denitrificans]|nr:hypothetical protein [Halomonas denitrificans]